MSVKRGWNRAFFDGKRDKTEVVAHRGGAGEVPEETLLACKYAVEQGIDVLEIDVHSTLDGELVLMHNDTVNETTDGKGYVHVYTLENIQKFNAAYNFTKDGENFPFRSGEHDPVEIRVPTLREVFQQFGKQRMVIEIKQENPPIAATLGRMITDFDMTEMVLIASFYEAPLKEIRRKFPEIATSASTLELLKFIPTNTAFFNSVKIPEADAVQFGAIQFLINKRSIGAAHKQDMPFHAWTVNRLKDMLKMIDLGVDGIITDYPTCLKQVLEWKQSGTEITPDLLAPLKQEFPRWNAKI